MKVRYKAAIAIAVIVAGVSGSMYGAWAGDLPVAALSLVVFVTGFLIGNYVVTTLPGADEDDVDPLE